MRILSRTKAIIATEFMLANWDMIEACNTYKELQELLIDRCVELGGKIDDATVLPVYQAIKICKEQK